jgi:hypothetical protein
MLLSREDKTLLSREDKTLLSRASYQERVKRALTKVVKIE